MSTWSRPHNDGWPLGLGREEVACVSVSFHCYIKRDSIIDFIQSLWIQTEWKKGGHPCSMFWEITEMGWPREVQKCVFPVTLTPPLSIHPTIYDLLIFMFNYGVATQTSVLKNECWKLETCMKLRTQFGSRKLTTKEGCLDLSLDSDHKTTDDVSVR